MLSPLRANHLARASPLSFNCARNIASTSNGNRRKASRPPRVSPEPASSPLPPPPAHRDASDGGDSLAASLNHYNSLPPLPPLDKWLSHFPYAAPVVRDRISIRVPESAIRVAHSFINSKRTSTGSPKVIIEAFPGAWCLGTLTVLFSRPGLGPGALSRALLTLPPSELKQLIILEDHEPYLEYLRVCFRFLFYLHVIEIHVYQPLARADPRVRVVPQSGFSWDTYSYLSESGDLDVGIAPWDSCTFVPASNPTK
jgi:hypothetical protein